MNDDSTLTIAAGLDANCVFLFFDGKDGTLHFRMPDGRSALALTTDGRVLRYGREIAQDAELVDGLRAWLAAAIEPAASYLTRTE